MYLHYYHNLKHCGQVDSDLVFDYPKDRAFIVVAHNQDKEDALSAFKLIYGRDIEVVTPAQAYDLFARRKLPPEVFTTGRAGSTLNWDERVKRLCI